MLTATAATTTAMVVYNPSAYMAARMALLAACKDPSDSMRAVMGAAHLAQDVAYTFLNLGYATWYRDSHYLSESGRALSSAPGDFADTAVYSVAALVKVVPMSEYVLPIGWAWGKLRGHTS